METMERRIVNVRVLFLTIAMATAGCAGAIGEGESDDPSSPADPSGVPGSGGSGAGVRPPGAGGSGGGAGGATGGSGPAAACTPAGVLPAPMRRLSHSEYLASLAELFPGLQI